jgi:hypothetical protein
MACCQCSKIHKKVKLYLGFLQTDLVNIAWLINLTSLVILTVLDSFSSVRQIVKTYYDATIILFSFIYSFFIARPNKLDGTKMSNNFLQF